MQSRQICETQEGKHVRMKPVMETKLSKLVEPSQRDLHSVLLRRRAASWYRKDGNMLKAPLQDLSLSKRSVQSSTSFFAEEPSSSS